jgi:hypothetical protein
MKRLAFFAVVFGIILPIAYRAEAAINPEDIVGIWLLDEGKGDETEDSSGNGHDGVLVQPANWVDGKFGNALEFPGSGQVKLPLVPEFDLVTWTLVGWYKGTPTGDKWQGIMGKPNTGSRNYALIYLNASGSLRAEFTAGAGNWRAANSKTSVSDDEWHHVAGTYDQKKLRVWVDGVPEAEVLETAEPSVQVDNFFSIGTSGGHKCNGIVDDVGLFRVGLEEGDIKRIMELGLAEALQAAVSSQDKLAVTWGGLKSE